jgi:hypothetical protein
VARRQVFDIPEPAVVVTEHQIVTVACGCGHHTTAEAPAGATAPVSYGPRIAAIGVYLLHGQFLSVGCTAHALRDLFAMPVAPGTVACWVKRSALGIIEQVLPVIADRIAAASVAHFDETGLRVDGRLAWLHSASTATDVLLAVHRRRGTEAMNAIGVLPRFAGVAMHDAWAPYDTYTTCRHALCNAHALRELVYVSDTATGRTAALADQAIDALTTLWRLTDAAHATQTPPDTAATAAQQHQLRSAVVLGAQATATRANKLQRKHHAVRPARRPPRRLPTLPRRSPGAVRQQRGRADHPHAETEDQSLRLHAHPDRSRTLRRDPQLHRDRHPTRPGHARRPHPSRHRQPLDSRHRLNPVPGGTSAYPKPIQLPSGIGFRVFPARARW